MLIFAEAAGVHEMRLQGAAPSVQKPHSRMTRACGVKGGCIFSPLMPKVRKKPCMENFHLFGNVMSDSKQRLSIEMPKQP